MNRKFVFALIIFAAALAACSSIPPLAPATPVTPTRAAARSTFTPSPAANVTAGPSTTPTLTPYPPVAIVKLPANVRAGPGVSYPIIGRCKSGARYPILGKSEDGKWWQIQFNDRLSWIPADFTDVQGGTNLVAIVSVSSKATSTPRPPTPSRRGTIEPTATLTRVPSPAGRIYFVIQGRASWMRPGVPDQLFQDANIGTPGDLKENLYTNASPLDWSPNVNKLAYVLGGAQDTLRVHDQATERLLDTHDSIVTPRWFGGGTQIAFVGYDNNLQNQAIYVINADGSKPAGYRCFAARPGEQLRGLTVNRRSGEIVFVSNYSGKYELWKMDRACKSASQLTRDSAEASAPAYSPDGTRIAYTSNKTRATDYRIYIMNADGSNVTMLGPGFAPCFSPDGHYLAFARNLEVYIMDVTGAQIDPLTPGDKPTWAP